MPTSALRHVSVDFTLRLDEMAKCFATLTREPLAEEGNSTPNPKLETEVRIARDENALKIGVLELGTLSVFSCPECHGSLLAIHEGAIERFRCHTGHAFSLRALVEEGTVNAERAMWAALAQLEEHRLLLRQIESHARESQSEWVTQYERRGLALERLIEQLGSLVRDPALRDREEMGGELPSVAERGAR